MCQYKGNSVSVEDAWQLNRPNVESQTSVSLYISYRLTGRCGVLSGDKLPVLYHNTFGTETGMDPN